MSGKHQQFTVSGTSRKMRTRLPDNILVHVSTFTDILNNVACCQMEIKSCRKRLCFVKGNGYRPTVSSCSTSINYAYGSLMKSHPWGLDSACKLR